MKLAKGRTRPIPGTMNKTEESYRDYLEVMRNRGEIEEFWWEGIKLKLANKTTYTMNPTIDTTLNDLDDRWHHDRLNKAGNEDLIPRNSKGQFLPRRDEPNREVQEDLESQCWMGVDK